ncbi:hypothetical protein NMG60_11015931 [Bertholletia excelsa]
MGACMSSAVASSCSWESDSPTAIVISSNGNLRQYSLSLTVSQVLLLEYPNSLISTLPPPPPPSSSDTATAFFLCNSDRLCYDEYIPPLDAQEQLQAHQIYFVLPTSKLQYPLSASDMAALAVKASLALQSSLSNTPNNNRRFYSFLRNCKNSRVRVSPVLEQVTHSDRKNKQSKNHSFNSSGSDSVDVDTTKTTNYKVLSDRSGSGKKLQRFSSKRFKLAPSSFRLRLATIYEEGSLEQFY